MGPLTPRIGKTSSLGEDGYLECYLKNEFSIKMCVQCYCSIFNLLNTLYEFDVHIDIACCGLHSPDISPKCLGVCHRAAPTIKNKFTPRINSLPFACVFARTELEVNYQKKKVCTWSRSCLAKQS